MDNLAETNYLGILINMIRAELVMLKNSTHIWKSFL